MLKSLNQRTGIRQRINKKILTQVDNMISSTRNFIILGVKNMQEIMEIAEEYGISLSESDIALSNERWDDGKKTIIIASGRLY